MHKGAMPHRPHQMWKVAASAGGWEGSYDSKKGFGLTGPGYQTVQPSAVVSAMPASSSHLFKLGAKRKTLANGDLILEGIQSIGTIGTITSSGTNEALVVGGTTRQAALSLSPDVLGGQMALDARNYSYYKFLAVEIIFIMNAPSTDALGVGCAFSPDPAIADFQTVTAASIKTSKDYFSFTRKEPKPIMWSITRTLKDVQYQKLNTEYDSTSSASKRQTLNGIFYFFFSANDTSATTVYGDVLIKFSLKLMNREPDYGFNISIVDNKWALWVWTQIQQRMEHELKQHHASWTKKKLGIEQKGENPWDASVAEVTDWPTERNNYVMKRINRYRATSRQAQYLLPVAFNGPQAYVTPMLLSTNGSSYPMGMSSISTAGVPLVGCQTHLQTADGNSFPAAGVEDTTQTIAAVPVTLPIGNSGSHVDIGTNAVRADVHSGLATVVGAGITVGGAVTSVLVSTTGSQYTLVATASSTNDTKFAAIADSPPVVGDDGEKYVKLRLNTKEGRPRSDIRTTAVGKTYAEAAQQNKR